MAKTNVKRIREQCNVMNDAWAEGAAAAKFSGISVTAFKTDIDAAAADDAAIDDLEAQIKLRRDARDDKYTALDVKRSTIGMAVASDPAYGNDSPLYGAMGFVRKSERKSGLTKKTKKP